MFSKASCPRQSLWEGPWALPVLQEDGAWSDSCSEIHACNLLGQTGFLLPDHSHWEKVRAGTEPCKIEGGGLILDNLPEISILLGTLLVFNLICMFLLPLNVLSLIGSLEFIG